MLIDALGVAIEILGRTEGVGHVGNEYIVPGRARFPSVAVDILVRAGVIDSQSSKGPQPSTRSKGGETTAADSPAGKEPPELAFDANAVLAEFEDLVVAR